MAIPTLGEFSTLGRGFSEIPVGGNSLGIVPIVAPTFKATSANSNNIGGPGPLTVGLGSYTTVANDCIVIGWQTNGAGAETVTGSGAGATWTSFQVGTGAPTGLTIGYACTAGNTSCTITLGSSDTISWVVGVFSGAAFLSSPIGTPQSVAGASVSTVTTPSASYLAPSVVVAVRAETGGGNFSTQSWGNGSTNTVAVSQTVIQPFVALDYITPPGAGSTTYTFSTTGATGSLRAMIVGLVG